jgi:hypothetical protein
MANLRKNTKNNIKKPRKIEVLFLKNVMNYSDTGTILNGIPIIA